ncbi:tRNA 2-thiouridine(34) synthase MnmA [Fusobacterium sp. SYSU M8A802]
MDRNRVVIGMSGGIDSSVSVHLLLQEGYEVIGVTLNHKKEDSLKYEIQAAQKVAEFFNIKHRVIDIEEIFQKEVIDDFLRGYSSGITPSPCVICDERVKMKILFDIAEEEGAYYIATGHYCSTEFNDEYKRVLLKRAEDIKKDQSYMLYRLTGERIERLLFPLFKYTKSEIREIGKSINLEIHDKKDSQGICFAKAGYIDFIRANLKDEIKKGDFVDSSGKKMGEHQGYQLYTIGQRRGLDLKLPRAYFITQIIPERNEIVLGEYEELAKKRVELVECKFAVPLGELVGKELIGRPRFSSIGALGMIVQEEDKVYFEYNVGNVQNASGQHLVIYSGDFVLGGGMIKY